jgi:hypothetical protein
MDKIKQAIEQMKAAGLTYKLMADLVNLRLAKTGSDKRVCTRTIINAAKMEKHHKMHIDRREAIISAAKKFK